LALSMRVLTVVGFVAIVATARIQVAWMWPLVAASAACGLAFTVVDLRWPRVAAGLLAVSSLCAAAATAGDRDLTAAGLLCLALLVLASLVTPTAKQIVAVAAVDLAVAATAGYLAGQPTAVLVANVLAVLVVLLFGLHRRQHRVQVRQAAELLAQTRLAQQAVADQAALRERARIAREIHDIQSHSLSALSLHLQAAVRLLDGSGSLPDPERAATLRRCVERAASLTHDGIAETRRAVHALRGDTVALPDLLDSLAEDADDATVRVEGTPRDLAPEATLTLYRAAQEGLTNARKHAPGAPVVVTCRYDAGQTTVTVTNPAGTGGVPAGGTPGSGLLGLRERAELAGGSCDAGPDAAGWRLTVTIPDRSGADA